MPKKTKRAKRILVTGAGGSAATNFVRSLRMAPESFYLVGIDCNKYYLQRAETDKKYLVPEADDPDYISVLRDLIKETRTDFIYCQTDQEIYEVSQHRDEMGVRTFLPDHPTIEICHSKYESFRRWKQAGLKVPETILIQDENDLKCAFKQFGKPIWLRAVVSSGGGKGSFPAKNVHVARAWLDFSEGWGKFTAAECLRPDSTTWTSIWNRGELVVAQGRKRLYWEFGNRSPSGVTGLTGTGITITDPKVDEIAMRVVHAIDTCPHGIFAVDLTYDRNGVPNPTEINIARFFTTHFFFTKAGLNMPYLYVKLAFNEPVPSLKRKVNPLPQDLAWIRGMDFLPILTKMTRIERSVEELSKRKKHLNHRSDRLS